MISMDTSLRKGNVFQVNLPRCPNPILSVGILLSIHQRGADGLVLQDQSFEASLGFPVNGGCRNNGVDCLLEKIDTRCGY